MRRLLAFFVVVTLASTVVDSSLAQWVHLENSAPRPTWGIAFCNSILVASAFGSGLERSTDRGASWTLDTPSHNFRRGISVFAVAAIGRNLFAGSWSSGEIYRSTDRGESWDYVDSGVKSSDIMAFASIGPTLFAATSGGGALRSSDEGAHWANVSKGLTTMGRQYVNGFAVIADTIYATTGDNLYRSTDLGDLWTPVEIGTEYAIEHGKNGYGPIAAIGSTLILSNPCTSPFLSCYDGASWTTRWLSSGYRSILGLFTYGGAVFAASEDGVFVSSDSGKSWPAANAGMVNTRVSSFGFDGSTVYAGTLDSGIWRRPLSELVRQSAVHTNPAADADLYSYPNPFSQSTTISFPSERGYGSVSIVNLLGVEITRLFDGHLDQGEHRFVWQPAGLPDGVYECVIRMNGRIEKQALVIQR